MLLTALLLAGVTPPREDDDREKPRTERAHRRPNKQPAQEVDDDDEPKAAPPAPAPARDGADVDERSSAVQATVSGQSKRDADDDEAEEGRAQPGSAIVVTARRLDAARTLVDVGLGATVTSLSNDVVEKRPGGETGSIATILQQVPGAVLSGRSLTVRGSAANQVRINNVIVPEAISDPADLLSARLAETTRLITGTLPAQFGFAPAGVISITTKNGLYQHGGQAELFAGTDGMIEPALEWAGSAAQTSLFASASLEQSRALLADATGARTRERGRAVEGLGFADHVIDGKNRVSVILGGSQERHRLGATSIGAGVENSGSRYGVVTLQHSDEVLTVQASLFGGLGEEKAAYLRTTEERRSSWGSQIDAAATVGAANTLRFGLLATRSTLRQMAKSEVRRAARTALGLYAQDEWLLGRGLTLNPGLRADWLEGPGHRPAIEPRASLVWAPSKGLTAHVGYARHAAAPPLDELTAVPRLGRESDDVFDAGLAWTGGPLAMTADAYSRRARGLLVERRIVGSALPDTFQFDRGRLRGIELSGNYVRRGTTAWASLTLSRAQGSRITGGGAIFAAATLAATANGYIPLGTDRPVRVAGGLTQRFGRFTLGADALLSSGAVRTVLASAPNGARRSFTGELGLAGVLHSTILGRPADIRLDLTNLTDVHAATNDATALEGDWTHFARRRALTIGIEQGF